MICYAGASMSGGSVWKRKAEVWECLSPSSDVLKWTELVQCAHCFAFDRPSSLVVRCPTCEDYIHIDCIHWCPEMEAIAAVSITRLKEGEKGYLRVEQRKCYR